MLRGFYNRVIEIPEKLQSALVGALLVYAVMLEVWLSDLISGWLGTPIDLTGAFAPLAAGVALVLVVLFKALLEKIIPEALHPFVNSFLVWLAGFFGAMALLRVM